MEVLKPPLIWVDGRCYRTTACNQTSTTQQTCGESNDYDEDTGTIEYSVAADGDDCVNDEPTSCVNDVEPVMTKSGQYELTVDIPKALCYYVVGYKGEMKKKIEYETRTRIQVPWINQGGLSVIRGSNRDDVERALKRIQNVMDLHRRRQAFTHFVSLPINSETIGNRFQEFKDRVMEHCASDIGIREKLFPPATKLHLTIVPLVLLSEAERKRAVEILNGCGDSVVKAVFQDKRLVVRMKGIEIMNDDPSEVDVLYAKVSSSDGSHRLQLMADMLVEKFVGSGLVPHLSRERVKLHVTLMNSRFDDWSNADDDTRQQRRESFDSRRIIELFNDYDFGEMHLDFVHLSTRYSSGKDGYYMATTKLQLP